MKAWCCLLALLVCGSASAQDPIGRGALNGILAANASAVPFRVLTTSARTAVVEPLGQIVWDKTLLAFYVGDGSTAGGVASPTGISNSQAMASGWIVPRHRNLSWRLQSAVRGGTSANTFSVGWFGNSIAEGDGCSNSANRPPAYMASLLASYTGISSSNWPVQSNAVGGSTTVSVMSFLANAGDAGSGYPQRPTLFPTGSGTPGAAILLTLRNDAGKIPLANWGGDLRACLQTLRRRNVDAILVIDPPQINVNTGALLDTPTNWAPWYNLALAIASDEGASVVDVWGYWEWLASRGLDLRTLTTDGTHPNDVSSQIMTSLVFQCMTAAPRSAPQIWGRGLDIADGYDLVSSYNEVNGATLSTISSTAGTLIGPTSRQLQNGENPAKVYQLASGSTLFFAARTPYRSVIVQCLSAPDATGTINVGVLGGSTTALAGVTPVAVGGYVSPFVRQYDVRYEGSGALLNAANTVTVQATGGKVYVLGVTFVSDYVTECHDRWAAAVTSGTWSNSSDSFYFGSSVSTISSSTVGDTCTVTFYGSSLSFVASTGPADGKFTYTYDGGAATTQDLYALTSVALRNYSLRNGTGLAYHTLVITVAAKNSSSSANTVNIGGWRVTADTQPPASIDVMLNAGETFNLTDYWSQALIVSSSGSPTAPQWTAGASSYTLGGSGSATVRFIR